MIAGSDALSGAKKKNFARVSHCPNNRGGHTFLDCPATSTSVGTMTRSREGELMKVSMEMRLAGKLSRVRESQPSPVIVVPAVYREWERRGVPSWACPARGADYAVAPVYQRLDPVAPRYVPNFAFEAGVYLRFVVDHYDRLPDITAFLQGDAHERINHLGTRLSYLAAMLRKEPSVGYLPLNDMFVKDRPASLLGDKYNLSVATCWKNVARWFGKPHAFGDAPPKVSMYASNYFAAHASANIHRHPLATWRWVYERVVLNHSCVDGRVPDAALGKHETAGAFEHLAPIIWGGGFGTDGTGKRGQSRAAPKCQVSRRQIPA
ncbi:hypothetical protein EMIHUDRAFT_197272 [Emiliania huxleyi CCMP1516]|uniref:Uncharacterized protein n=2 Tax=Emiliania huxleyi TaxID=2903 RepID=A0A0D3IU04_EMIH1|nr:hypothetical protein EMIHUDRAFT_197272 [Emiliania huxleyi CCMP1516]EOD14739.1 hypothetical protein EMIHUDRAFT_197272 [Emiliania huxleyi CCMP1516]|eukprot:XP_005767168.1 hypothetical protein EMIHUDRAFT_197272 [Emiliania huxleyi CCMP1516]